MAVLVQLSRGCWRTARGILDCLTSSGLVTCAELASKRAMAPVQCLCTSSQASATAAGHTLRTLRTTPCVRGREIDGSRVSVTFTDRDGDVQRVRARLGDNLLEVAREYDIDLEGACDGTLSCSTCHLVVDPDWFPKITDPITEEEEDMLDLAYGLTDTSRLGCQVVVTEDLDGLKLTIPMATADAREV